MVAPSEARIDETVAISPRACEAFFVADLVDQWIDQRRQNIRSLYQRIAEEAGSDRKGE